MDSEHGSQAPWTKNNIVYKEKFSYNFLEKYEMFYKKKQSFTFCSFLRYWLNMKQSIQRFLDYII